MPYIGNTIRAADDYRLIDDISSGFNGSATSFALQVAGSAPVPFPKSPQQVLISVNGVIQEPDPTGASGFNLVGTNIVFSSAPTNGHAFFGIIYATADYLNAGGNFPSGSLGAPSFTFIGDENTGLYRKSGGSVGFVSDATEIANFDSNGITISSGNLIIPDSIIHSGDTDTKIRFPSANVISFETAGVEKISMGTGEITFNDTGADVDFRIEGDTNANLFKLDAGNDRVGIGTSSPQQVFHVYHASDNGIGLFESGDANCRIDLKDNSGQVSIEAIGDQLRFGTTSSNTERVRLTSAGKLGLGTTGPSSRFSIVDSTTFTAFASTVPNATDCMLQLANDPSSEAINNHSTIQFGVNGGTHNRVNSISAVAESASNRKLAFTFCTDSGSNRSERLRISADGHVLPGADSTYNIGSNSNRFANGYFDTLYGDGSNLTNITSTTINNNAANRVVTGSGTANTLSANSDLLWNGSRLDIDTGGTEDALRIGSSSGADTFIRLGSVGTSTDTHAVIKYDIDDNNLSLIISGESHGSAGIRILNGGNVEADDILPFTDNSRDLGSSSKRWRNVYTTDLKLSNEGSQNDVDSTWGNYTIQEGHEDLFLINHRTGKKFKFNLTEVA